MCYIVGDGILWKKDRDSEGYSFIMFYSVYGSF